MSLAQVKSTRNPHHYTGLSIDTKPTGSVEYGATYYETNTNLWFIFTAAGWVQESLPAIIATISALPGTAEADIATMAQAMLEAGAAMAESLGQVTVTPAVAAAVAYVSGDIVGGKITLANALRSAASLAILESLRLVDTAKQNAPLTVHFFGADLAGAYADNAAEAVTAADWLKWLGCVEIRTEDYEERTNASLVDFDGIGKVLKAVSGTTLYALIVLAGAATYTENCLQLTCGFGERS